MKSYIRYSYMIYLKTFSQNHIKELNLFFLKYKSIILFFINVYIFLSLSLKNILS